MKDQQDDKMDKITALCKRRGFVFQGSEIYGGLKGTWDLGPLGVALNNNIKKEWWKMFVDGREDMYGLDASILMNAKVWEASGHTATFTDPFIVCEKCGQPWRADHLIESQVAVKGIILCPNANCRNSLGTVEEIQSKSQPFNLMFKTNIGASSTSDSLVYLRPETAQGIFVNFKNVVDSMSPKMPFGIAQIGKAFRNEIAPREFLFRVREFEQMEIEYFVKEEEWTERFEEWRLELWKWFDHLGLNRADVQEYEVLENDLAHYSKRTIDFEYNFPGKGFDELAGFAYRTDHDLRSHQEASGVSLKYTPAEGEAFIPHVLEPSFGVGRALTAVLCAAYTEDEMNGEVRSYLKLPNHLAPYRVAVTPLLKNKSELVEKARTVFLLLKKEFGNVAYDENGNIGKRYRRQDEIGTPYCIVIDFETLGQEAPEHADTVTVRHRDTGEQTRVKIEDLISYLK